MQTKQCTLRAIATKVVYFVIFRCGNILSFFQGFDVTDFAVFSETPDHPVK